MSDADNGSGQGSPEPVAPRGGTTPAPPDPSSRSGSMPPGYGGPGSAQLGAEPTLPLSAAELVKLQAQPELLNEILASGTISALATTASVVVKTVVENHTERHKADLEAESTRLQITAETERARLHEREETKRARLLAQQPNQDADAQPAPDDSPDPVPE